MHNANMVRNSSEDCGKRKDGLVVLIVKKSSLQIPK
jgi:hypothetical protein